MRHVVAPKAKAQQEYEAAKNRVTDLVGAIDTVNELQAIADRLTHKGEYSPERIAASEPKWSEAVKKDIKSLRVERKTSIQAGSCNFCNAGNKRWIYLVESTEDNRHLQVRFCSACLSELISCTNDQYLKEIYQQL